jgi:type IV secretory pathway VirD2 relaxase
LFDAKSDTADRRAFVTRCAGDRHHFRFIVSPEDAAEMADLRAFTRELMTQAEADLGTRLDWVAVAHWNTDNPHVHVLVRGVTEDGADLVISRDYISRGLRARAEALVSLELGPRSEQAIQTSLEREVEADRWTGFDQVLRAAGDEGGGIVGLRPGAVPLENGGMRQLLIGRATKLQRLGLAEPVGPAQWTLKPGLESTLRALGERDDIIKALHGALSRDGRNPSVADFAIHAEEMTPILGRLADRGLHDELAGTAYIVIDGVDGRAHHLRLPDLEATGDAPLGAIVEARSFEDAQQRRRLALLVRSDLGLEAQVSATGATWLDRQAVAREPSPLAGKGFGAEVIAALHGRAEHLIGEGLAHRHGARIVFARDLIATLRQGELNEAVARIVVATGLPHRPSAEGEHVGGVYRERVTLASGRFAMIDDGLGFQLVPWRQSLDRHLGQQVSGVVTPGGGIDWHMGRKRGLAI